MENIILIGHGSPKKDANNLDLVGKLLHKEIHPDCNNDCVKVAYLQFAEPEIADTIKVCADSGAKKIIIHPYFLNSGIHVTKDIPQIIKGAEEMYPHIEFIYTEPLGIHEKLIHAVMDRIYSANGMRPDDIEKRSFGIISEEIDLSGILPEHLPVVKRVIHATADFEFKNTLMFHPDAARAGIDAIRAGKDILTDVEMVRAGINKRLLGRWGGKVVCNIQNTDNPSIPPLSKGGQRGVMQTKAEVGIESALKENNNIGIVAIGNAPTALLKVIELLPPPASPP